MSDTYFDSVEANVDGTKQSVPVRDSAAVHTDEIASEFESLVQSQNIDALDTTSKNLVGGINELNSKSKGIRGNKEISIEVKKYSNILIIIGKSLTNAGRYIYAASSNAETVYAFTKIAGSDDNDDFETEVDGLNIIFRANAYIDAIIFTS